MKYTFLYIVFYLCSFGIFAQQKPQTSSEILQGLLKLNTVGNVMYVAAHPDDENTLLISWFSKERKVRTAYIALTRGDGGQNLIGSEQGEYVGLLRTHELLEARKIDGGEQYFSRAKDFGFTKKTEEALTTWGKEKILEDLVFQIRKFKPDVIINRFPPDDRAGHGHHSASAQLAAEAFDDAADPKKFPGQLKTVNVWQAKRLVWNAFNRGFTNTAPSEGSFVKASLGDFNPMLGKSYPEIAAEARSKHRSQGFGSSPTRNERFDYLLHVKGDTAKNDIFDGIDITWNRIDKNIGLSIDKIIENFDINVPAKSVSGLLGVYSQILQLPNSSYKENKLTECLNLIMACSGLFLEANAAINTVSPGQTLKVFTTATNRSDIATKLISIKYEGFDGLVSKDTVLNSVLANNKIAENANYITIPKNAPITQPYWLWEKPELGFYKISNENHRGLPMAPAALIAKFNVEIMGQTLIYNCPIDYKYNEPSRGEIHKYLEVRPEILLGIEQKVIVFTDKLPKKVGVWVKSNIENTNAKVSLAATSGFKISPNAIDVDFKEKNQSKQVFFEVTPLVDNIETELFATATNTNGTYNRGLVTVNYEHIPELNVFPVASSKIMKIDLKIQGKNIGYIAGAGDEVPDALRQMGYNIDMITANNIMADLSKYYSIIVGVRAYNTEDWLANAQGQLLDYVKNGGNLVVQYQTQAFYGAIKTKELGPYPFSIGRGRVTDENAEVKFLKPQNELLNFPNKISQNDFKGWIQERGLYFADKWSDKYTTIFAMKDVGETEQEGSLLYAKYGKGNYIFTGLAFFRELPAGVAGAYRLMANLISAKK